ncbi:cardiac-enriched FHL2-interacting protein [Colossoma macropomum]|uniref:cardiac-enriched FHL2-interacting protein n=1 Tax=Colossoma macropomum TaxID=42526 RepID=UPI001863B09D|nr:cardiac-enriched FHL2-interacting protein [Colossoma macropomum]
MHGHHKYSDGFSDTSSVGSFMDETDREVSNLTDRAFRSLCIGEEAIYNDSEISSPTERHKAFAEEVQQKEVVKTTCQETFSYGIQYREAERKSEVTSTFQHSYVDVAQEQVLRDERMSYMSNGSMEATWQQRRSTSRVSSLIKAFSSKEGYCDSGISDAVLIRDKYRDFNNGSWDKSALLSFQRELSEVSSAYHQNFKSGPFQSYRNHFHASAAAVSRMDTTASLVKSSKTKFHALNSTNFFFHSEFSPFQLWKDYNRFPFEREEPSGFLSASEFPRWYDSPLYKELTTTQTFSSEGRRFNRKKIEDVVPTQRSRSTVIQKASAIEKRCDSEMASNCPPWKRNNNFVRSKLPSNRPSTVSPTNEKAHRPDSNLLSYNRHTYDIQHKVENVGGNELSSSSTPFSITQLLTPVIHGRQETETSEILQFAHTPSFPDYSVQGDVDLKPLSEVKQLRDNYKSRASSLLFNLKDNRKRVKSTYSPSKFKGLEITDRNKQPSKLEDLESRLSDSSASQVTTQEHSAVPNAWELDVVQQTYDVHLSQTVEHKEYADGLHDMTLAHQNGAANYEISYGGSQGSFLPPYKPLNKENEEYEFSPRMLPAQNQSIENSEGHIYGPSGTFNPTRPETENIYSKAHPPVHSLSAQMSEKQNFSRREDMGHRDFKEQQNFVMKPNFGYTKNQVTEERLSWENSGHTNITSREMFNNSGIKDSLPFKGEIATLIEMDKQRKATAKQYLPSANDSYTVGKETYINKVNENIKQGRLAKEEEVQDTECSSQKYQYTSKPAQYNPTNTPSTSQNVYGFYNNGLHKMTSSPPKDSKLTKNSEFRKHDIHKNSSRGSTQDWRAPAK